MSIPDGEVPEALPERLPVLPLRDTVTYPDTLTPLAVGQERSIQLVNDALVGDRMLVMLGSKDPELETPGPDELHTVGVAGVVVRMLKVPDGSLRILVQGGQRVRIEEWIDGEPYLVARVSELPDVVDEGPELTALMRNVQQTFTHIIEEVPYLPEELQMAVANLEDPSALAHLIAGALRIKIEEKQALLEEVDVGKRLRRLSEILARELDIVAIGSKIQSQVMSEMESSQREYVLRQQLKAIQEELGEKDPAEAEVDELREQLAAIALPDDVRKQADRELSRLEKLPQAAAEHGVIRTYLEWIASLPWDKRTDDNLDLAHAREVLDADHYDIEKVKDRILEFLAVHKLKPDATGSSIMCFVGPPGVGKTSLGRSIARAMGRKFERISAGGVRDEAEIRGHRRTYIGAMPGTIIRALRDAGANNPLFMIDEIDKMGADYRGDPAQRDARGARSRAELDASATTTSTSRSTSRTSSSSPPRTRWTRSRRRCATAWRSSSSRATRRRRSSRSPSATWSRARSTARASSARRSRSPTRAEDDHRRLHARGGRAQPRARDRLASAARSRAASPRARTTRKVSVSGPRVARAARPRALHARRQAAHAPSRAWRPGSPGRRSAATCCSSRRPRCRARAS